MVSGFWQLVLDNNVTLILMITKLEEKKVFKAHQYWPDNDHGLLKLENGINVMIKSKEADKCFERRTFLVSNTGTQLK